MPVTSTNSDGDLMCDHEPGTNHPGGYVAWHEWAGRKSKTHQQVRCDECGLFKVWVLK